MAVSEIINGSNPQQRQITDDIFLAYLHCPYKAYLKAINRTGTVPDQEKTEKSINDEYRPLAAEKISNGIQQSTIIDYAGSKLSNVPTTHSLCLNASLQSCGISVHIDAIEKVHRKQHFVPIIFIPRKTISTNDRLALNLTALVLSMIQGQDPPFGKIIHGSGLVVKKFIPQSQKAKVVLESLNGIVAGVEIPRLILNRHCETCEFKSECRAKAIENDEISLIQTMLIRLVDNCVNACYTTGYR